MSHPAEHEWTSYHIFYHGSSDRVLARLVLPVVRALWERRRIRRFFFIRYGLGGPHIRLRLLRAPEHRKEIDEDIRGAAAAFFRRWPAETQLAEQEIRRRNQHFLANEEESAIDTVFPNHSLAELPFQPEVERYGGPALIASSLDFFCVSSACVLQWICEREDEPRSRRLSRALRILLRQALGFAAGGEDLYRLVGYAAPGHDPGSPLIARADQEFERRRDDYVGLVGEEIEIEDSMLTSAARALRGRIRDAAGPGWPRIVISHLHMTSNRLGLMKVEEGYLGHILRRALGGAAAADRFVPAPGLSAENGLDALIMVSLDQLIGSGAVPREV